MPSHWRRTLLRILPLLALGMGLGGIQPARALVPYVYVPQRQELEGAALGIAQAAARLLQLGQAEDAARLAALTVQMLPADPRGWVLLAEAQLRSEQTAAAVLSLDRARELDPENAGIWFAQGSLALRDGRPAEALQLLRQGLRRDPRNASAFFDVGNAHILLDQPTEAYTAFERAAELRRDFWEAINNQALVLFEQGKADRAIERWRRVLQIRPEAAEPNLALASALFERGPQGRQEALERAARALDSEPNYVLESYQKEQLWGPRLRSTTRRLLEIPELRADVDRAQANASF
ncbi:tetratricopeptide repeat protein [Cyanobium sp. CH-040]|uniref:tetratricopeptide repeat protein n=1 Tax=Cyanobium sp. CH-040 TaxID=2823708 RepID=UPI0020CC68A3|nr:tetratricopeptide repeat protein [Cyanobium sp. CH-040]MCP9927104.1 tetratricopeptide repeat protein [Cyanobium sp. CH-040]